MSLFREYCLAGGVATALVLITPVAAQAATPVAPAVAPAGVAAPYPKLVLPDFSTLAEKASDSVSITLDPALLHMAAGFLNSNDPKDAATLEVIKGLQGIYVRSYTFDKDAAYSVSDIDAVRRQLAAPGWTQLMQTRSRKTHADVDVYVMMVNGKALGLALIASEPRQFTIVNIVGAIDLDKLRKLEGQFGVPKLDLGSSKPPP
jgi:hypothetical protein